MTKVGTIVRIAGQIIAMIGRLAFIMPTAWYYRRRGARAFDRELCRLGVPLLARQALGRRYVEMIPLNPRRYWPDAEEGRQGEDREPSRRRSRAMAARDLYGS
jgi:hypothetical protein